MPADLSGSILQIWYHRASSLMVLWRLLQGYVASPGRFRFILTRRTRPGAGSSVIKQPNLSHNDPRYGRFITSLHHLPLSPIRSSGVNLEPITHVSPVQTGFGGSLSFDHHSHDWEAFKVRLTQFCVANSVTDENDKISGVGALFSLRRSPKTQCEWRQSGST
ncbi:hypothetical protein EVAR_74044_1 [Eumeta japonica]|uniref:Uncharacterized protein n=1 Tax=Eumeta variegata TaxID=151549 RepID=A0A4C1SS99_EUMVA|nr:hypothetical protein EVAR_74044_1 [Eumeta japonica]